MVRWRVIALSLGLIASMGQMARQIRALRRQLEEADATADHLQQQLVQSQTAATQPPLAHPRVTELPGSVPVFPATDLSLQDSAVASQNKQFVQHHLLREGSDAQYLSFLLQFRAVEEPKSWSHRHLEPKEFLLISLAKLLPRSTGINQHTATLTSCFVSDCINTCHTVPLPNR